MLHHERAARVDHPNHGREQDGPSGALESGFRPYSSGTLESLTPHLRGMRRQWLILKISWRRLRLGKLRINEGFEVARPGKTIKFHRVSPVSTNCRNLRGCLAAM